jgi:cytochrome c biogenesis protein CcdA
MLGLTLLVASVALADSVNPSTVIPALWLANASSSGGLASYTLGVFVAYLAGGLVLLLGPGPALIGTLRHVQGPIEHGVQITGGILALTFAVLVWRARKRTDDQPRIRRPRSLASAFALGAGIMTVELPTAFMYFGAISAIIAARVAAPLQVSLLITYNALFVAPLIVLLAFRHLLGARAERWIVSAEARLRHLGQLALTGVAGAAGAVLLALGLSGLLVL